MNSLVILFAILANVECYTHWMVSDDGTTIRAVSDSPYHMSQPHSLVQLMNQERMLDVISRSREEFIEQEKIIHNQEKADDPEIEKKIRITDMDCIMIGKMSLEKDAYMVPYDVSRPINDIEGISGALSNENDAGISEAPICETTFTFSMYTFDHLPSVQQRQNISILADTDLEALISSYVNVKNFGHYTAISLKKDRTNVSLLNLAAIYWRIQGNAQEAIDCLRCALHYSSSSKKKYAELAFALGNIVHRAGFSSDAIFLYRLSQLQLNDVRVHMAIADALVLIGNRSEALSEYIHAQRSAPEISHLSAKIASIKCDIKIINAMEKQHQNLLDNIAEKNSYNDRLKYVRNIEDNVRKMVASVEARMQSSLIFEYFTYGTIPHSTCRVMKRENRLATHCTVGDWYRYRNAVDEKYQKLILNSQKNSENSDNTQQEFENSDNSIDQNPSDFIKKLNSIRKNINLNEPLDPPIYPMKLNDSALDLVNFYLKRNWPSNESCNMYRWRHFLPSLKTLPQLFLSPDNKGYRISELLNKYLGLDPSDEHPLPWKLPYCSSFLNNQSLPAVFKLNGVIWAASRNETSSYMERKLRSVFMSFVSDGISEADVAQRITSLITHEIGPRWIVFNLAALYWRINGVPNEAVACLNAALINQDRHSDVTLVQLAQIVLQTAETAQHISDAASILSLSLQTNSHEPVTHVLRSVVCFLQEMYGASLKRAEIAMIMDPYFQPSISLMHALKCSSKIMDKKVVAVRYHFQCCSMLNNNVICSIDATEKCYKFFGNVYEASGCQKKNEARNVKKTCEIASAADTIILLSIRSNIIKESRTTVSAEIGWSRSPTRKKEDTYEKIDPSDEIPLDYGVDKSLERIKNLSIPLNLTLSPIEILYPPSAKEIVLDGDEIWTEEVVFTVVPFPKVRFTSLTLNDRRKMLRYDATLPDVLPLPKREQVLKGFEYLPLPKSSDKMFCSPVKMNIQVLQEQTTSMWVSMNTKGINWEGHIDLNESTFVFPQNEPVCPQIQAHSPLVTLDHLPAYHLHDQFVFYKPEKALTDVFQFVNNVRERVDQVAGRLHHAMAVQGKGNEADVHWTLSTQSSLYWRIKGDAINAIRCLRHSLNTAPSNMKDISLLGLANIYYHAGFLHSALISGGAALGISPDLVAIHFTLANIYASMADYHHALQFYYSTLSLQSSFEPAKERIRLIYCNSGQSSTLRSHFNYY